MSRRSAYIDAFRGFAILGVLFHHFFFFQILTAYPFETSNILGFSPTALNNGWLGVGLFFVLSGMVFYRPALAANWKGVLTFYFERALRLWPLYFLTILLVGYLDGFDVFLFLKTFALLPTGIHDFIPKYWEPGWVLWVFWSLGVEILFSVALPALLLAERRIGFGPLVIGVAVFCFLYRIAADHAWFVMHPDYGSKLLNPLKDNIFGRLDDFLIGMAAMRAIRNGIRIPAALALFAVLALLLVGNSWAYLLSVPRDLPQSILASINHSVFAAAIVIVILSVRNAAIWQGWIAQPLIFAGTVSYSTYVIHTLLLKYLSWRKGLDLETVFYFALFVLASLLSSAVTFTLVEAIGIKHLPNWARWTPIRRVQMDS